MITREERERDSEHKESAKRVIITGGRDKAISTHYAGEGVTSSSLTDTVSPRKRCDLEADGKTDHHSAARTRVHVVQQLEMQLQKKK